MSEPTFQRIEHCPVCLSTQCKDYLEIPYVGANVQEFLFRYYKLSERFGEEAYREFFDNHSFILSECRSCGVHFQRNRPSTDLAALVYDTWIGAVSSGSNAFERYGLSAVQHYVSEAMRLVAFAKRSSGVETLANLRAVDYGMGNGGFAMALKSCLVEVYGTEFSETRRSFAQKNGIQTFEIGEPLPKKHFHLINTEQVMEHLPNPNEVLAQFSEALAPGGILKISVPLSRSLESGDREIDWTAGRYAARSPTPLQPIEHLQYYARSSFAVIAERFGFERVHMPISYHFMYGLNWTFRGAIKNIGRAFLHEKRRNYVLLRKA